MMTPKNFDLYKFKITPNKINSWLAERYLKGAGLMQFLQSGNKGQWGPAYRDLARLHQIVVKRNSCNILEFGVGWSTIVLADALRLNEQRRNSLKQKSHVYRQAGNIGNATHSFQVFSVDSSSKWIEACKETIPPHLEKYIQLVYSPSEAGLFNGRACHFHKLLPDIVPDFIYLDGPNPKDVQGNVHGMTWQNTDRPVMAGDILLMEPILHRGTLVLIDGRNNNADFLANNLQRSWTIRHHKLDNFTTMELRRSWRQVLREKYL